jgi:hypothetical protein
MILIINKIDDLNIYLFKKDGNQIEKETLLKCLPQKEGFYVNETENKFKF